MPLGSDDRIGEQHFTDSAPNYSLFSRQAATAIGVAAALVALTIGLMWALADTAVATWTVWLFESAPLAPFIGVALFGVVLTIGRVVGLKSSVQEQYGVAFLASMAVAIAYGAFGAGILSLYAPQLHGPALFWTGVITTGFTILAGAAVYTTDYSFANWDMYSGICMLIGIIAIFIYSIIPIAVLSLFAFGIILLGWIIDLFFEIYMLSEANRSPIANGIGVYIAFMGVFVHLLQLVLEYMAEQ